MKQFVFWFNICMIVIYLSAGIALLVINTMPSIPENTRKLAGIVIICYGIYRLVASILKKKKVEENENEA